MANATDLPPGGERKYDSVLNWDVASEDDPKALARLAYEASTLATLIVAGLEVDELENAGNSEVYQPGRPSREQSPMLLPFIIKASSEEGIRALAKKHAEGWIDSHGGA
jgi:hypothetical protein